MNSWPFSLTFSGEEGSCGYTVLNMAPAVERRERSRRSPPPARSNSLERERRSPRRRSSPRRERSPNHRRDRSPVRTSSSHRVRSPPVKEKLPERARSPKHHRPRSPVGNGASSRSPSPRTKRLKRAQSEREAEHPSREEREKGKNRERGESRDGSRDRREDREKNDGGGLGRLSRRDRSISPEEHGRKARHGSRSPPRTSKAGERDEVSGDIQPFFNLSILWYTFTTLFGCESSFSCNHIVKSGFRSNGNRKWHFDPQSRSSNLELLLLLHRVVRAFTIQAVLHRITRPNRQKTML